MNTEGKDWSDSRTIWSSIGGVVAAILTLVQVFRAEVPFDIGMISTQVAVIAAFIGAIVYRVKADTVIGKTDTPAPTPTSTGKKTKASVAVLLTVAMFAGCATSGTDLVLGPKDQVQHNITQGPPCYQEVLVTPEGETETKRVFSLVYPGACDVRVNKKGE